MDTSLIIAFGTVIVTLVIAAPAAYGLAKFKLPFGRRRHAGAADLPDGSRHRDRQLALHGLSTSSACSTAFLGLVLADSSDRDPVRDSHHLRIHAVDTVIAR